MIESSAFISYHNSDQIVGQTVKRQLDILASYGAGREALKCFLDADNIEPSRPWQVAIDTGLKSSDWLIFIFTGDQSVYCGYEIGTFLQLHPELNGKFVTALYDVDIKKVPIILEQFQNSAIPNVDKVSIDDDAVTLEAHEAQTWFDTSLGRMLRKFCDYKKLYTVEHEKDKPDRYTINIALAAKRIANAFALARGVDVRHETITQLGFDITIKKAGEGRIESIPDDAKVVGRSATFRMLGLELPYDKEQAPSTTWGRLKDLVGDCVNKKIPWIHKIDADVVRAMEYQMASSQEVTFITNEYKVYRPILVSHKLFFNDDRQFNILFVETLDRRFTGEPRSSLLLTALILASRWRFTYFERYSDIESTFGKATPLPKFTAACRQLIYNIEWIENESVELGTANPNALINAFGSENKATVERFFSDWQTAKINLSTHLNLDTPIVDANRETIRLAIMTFLDETKKQNSDFLQLAANTYNDYVQKQIRP